MTDHMHWADRRCDESCNKYGTGYQIMDPTATVEEASELWVEIGEIRDELTKLRSRVRVVGRRSGGEISDSSYRDVEGFLTGALVMLHESRENWFKRVTARAALRERLPR